MFQNPYTSLDPRQTVGSALAEALRIHFDLDRASDDRRVAQLLERVGLDSSSHRRPRNLSGGQRQRVAIARALASEPATLVLDEAVSALDISVQAQVLNLINGLRRQTETALVFISHDLAAVAQVTDYIYVMHRGTVVEHGATAGGARPPRPPDAGADRLDSARGLDAPPCRARSRGRRHRTRLRSRAHRRKEPLVTYSTPSVPSSSRSRTRRSRCGRPGRAR